jgi:pimeloyl-ACP methyl ester carboxylesterase
MFLFIRRGAIVYAVALVCFFSVARAQDSSSVCAPQTQSINVGPSSIQYFKMGEGSPIVVLHGLFAQKEQWTDFACVLAKNGFAVIAPDLPGYGQSLGFPIESYQLIKEVEYLHRFTQKLKLHSFNIAGNSMGGAIAAMFAYQYPQEIRSIAFIGAPMGVISWSPQLKEAINSGINPFIPINVEQFNLEMSLLFAKPPELSNAIKEAAVAEYTKNNRHYQQVWNIVNLDIHVLETYPDSKKPTFITWGKEDGVFNISGKKRVDKKFPNHSSYELKEVAHLVMLEKPKEIADLYLQFLRSRHLQ